ncbi:DNA polymerase III subunit gamma/tau [Candidatus Saccharibacteria bacterium]|nr:DNA polymerase III subunit gamma/tau [Candidatus Saccharibacteria bacterium]
MKSLYRRYRPTKLAEVVGQEQVTKVLASSLEQGKISHAYLFIGPRGTGKTSVARIFAHAVNNFDYQIEDDYIDIIEIDGASNRGIDNIRELREKANIAPTTGKYKVYIIDEVHMLTKEAFNALLKTLEEPPSHVIFIMATTDAHKVPVTITSRAQTYIFRLADTATMESHLKTICEKEGIKITDEALTVVVKRGGGSFRDSLSLLDQISTLSDGTNEITKEKVMGAMGLPDDEKIANLLADYIVGDVVKITTLLKELLSSGIKPETLAEEMIKQIVDNPKEELLPLLAKLPEIKDPFGEAKLLVALAYEPSCLTTSRNTGVKTSVVKAGATIANVSTKSTNIGTANTNINGINTSTGITDFNWGAYVAKIKDLSDTIYSQLLKTTHELNGNTLDIYPNHKFVYNILSKDANKQILTSVASGIKIVVHEFGESPKNTKNDGLLAKISDIMGGEVKNDGGEDPF